MSIEKLERRNNLEDSQRLAKAYAKMQALIGALDKKDIPSAELKSINEHVLLINSFLGTDKALAKTLNAKYEQILKSVKEKLKFVPKQHYLKLAMVLGILAGVVFSSIPSIFGFMNLGSSQGMGISIGMLIGIVIGVNLDKQAKKEGRQLEV